MALGWNATEKLGMLESTEGQATMLLVLVSLFDMLAITHFEHSSLVHFSLMQHLKITDSCSQRQTVRKLNSEIKKEREIDVVQRPSKTWHAVSSPYTGLY